jgi:hypothetical protein
LLADGGDFVCHASILLLYPEKRVVRGLCYYRVGSELDTWQNIMNL